MQHPQLNPPKACVVPSGSAATKVAQAGKESAMHQDGSRRDGKKKKQHGIQENKG